MKYVERVFNFIFSETTLLIAFISFMTYSVYSIIDRIVEQEKTWQADVAYCYNLGMVLVDTDAGQRCVAPQNLVIQ